MRARALHTSLSLAVGLALGCGEPAARTVLVVLESTSAETPLPPQANVLGPLAETEGPNRFRVPLDQGLAAVSVVGFCPPTIAPLENGVVRVSFAPRVEVSAPAPVGHDAAFRLEVTPGCREALAGNIEWTLLSVAGALEGEAVEAVNLATERRGFVVTGRTPPLELGEGPSFGLVPISARHSGEIVLRMTWTQSGLRAVERVVRLLSAARTTGLPSIPTGAGVLLRGGPFTVSERPALSRANVSPAPLSLESFVPDQDGRWVLSDPAGRTVSLRVGAHVATPLDCGRSECHAREAEHALTSPMAGAHLSHLSEPCALPCHATSEPGLPDGGFAHVAREFGWLAPTTAPDHPLAELPRPLRRLAGVGCTACHGPGAIPEESARWAILRSDVCAVCHDAPPRYGHVAAWSRSPMSTSDASERTRASECAGCHTTAGFLEDIGARAHTDVPIEAGAIGIACAACHAPHSSARLETALVRRVETPHALGSLPSVWDGSTSSVCLSCHTPRTDGRAPLASSAAILLGRGGMRVEGGGPLEEADRAPHASVACLDCHGAAADDSLGVERGRSHAFAIDTERCVRCHTARAAPAGDDNPWARAAGIATRLGLGEDDHASGARAGPDTARGRAILDVRLVLGDRGAWAHAPGYAARVLDEAERGAHE